MPTVDLVLLVAAHNEEAALPALHPRLLAVAEALGPGVRVMYVDDGSRDGTWALMADFIAAAPDRVGAYGLVQPDADTKVPSAGWCVCVWCGWSSA